jgi:hypothetical protein
LAFVLIYLFGSGSITKKKIIEEEQRDATRMQLSKKEKKASDMVTFFFRSI